MSPNSCVAATMGNMQALIPRTMLICTLVLLEQLKWRIYKERSGCPSGRHGTENAYYLESASISIRVIKSETIENEHLKDQV